jgi:hypothetical protein
MFGKAPQVGSPATGPKGYVGSHPQQPRRGAQHIVMFANDCGSNANTTFAASH